MRRIPYIKIKDNKLYYLCPNCKHIIPRDLYKDFDYCKLCYVPLNRTAKSILKVYREVDLEFYDYFIELIKKGSR